MQDYNLTEFKVNELTFKPVTTETQFLADLDQTKAQFKVYNGEFISHLDVFMDESCTGIWRFTDYLSERRKYYYRENMNALYLKNAVLDVKLVKHAGQPAEKYHRRKMCVKLSLWTRLQESLNEAK